MQNVTENLAALSAVNLKIKRLILQYAKANRKDLAGFRYQIMALNNQRDGLQQAAQYGAELHYESSAR